MAWGFTGGMKRFEPLVEALLNSAAKTLLRESGKPEDESGKMLGQMAFI